MMRVLRLLTLLCMPIVPLGAQVSLTTSTGVTHLDGLTIRDAAALDGRVRLGAGPLRFDMSAATVAHVGLGRAAAVNSELMVAGRRGEWTGRIGPVLRAGGGLGARSTVMYGGGGELLRNVANGTLGVRLEEGMATVSRKHTSWQKLGFTGGYTLGALNLGFAYQRATIRDSALRDNVFFTVRDPAVDTRYERRVHSLQDLSLSAAYSHNEFALTFEAGRRAGDFIRSELWWRGGVSLEVAPMIALVANISRTPPDLLLRLRGGRSAMLGLKLNLAGSRVGARGGSAMLVESHREGGRRVRLIVVLDARDRADVMGDATGWKAMPLMRRGDGRWEVMLNASPGISRFNVSIDGGPWTTPEGVATLADGYGGRAFLVEL